MTVAIDRDVAEALLATIDAVSGAPEVERLTARAAEPMPAPADPAACATATPSPGPPGPA